MPPSELHASALLQTKSQPHSIPCRLHIEPGPASPAQVEAWRCLWRLLLAEDGTTTRPQKEGAREESA
jgi:hypothetical protein